MRDLWCGVGPKAYVSDGGKYKYFLFPLIIMLYENRNLSCEKPKANRKGEFIPMFSFQKKNIRNALTLNGHRQQ